MHPLDARKEIKKQLNQVFDVCVIGGGITGVGIARDAALRGLKVALVEKGDFASGTSSGSSKLVHAGFRYLAQKEFKLVREASLERKKILNAMPNLTRPLNFIIPIQKNSTFTKKKTRMGIFLYAAMASFKTYKRHRLYNRSMGVTMLPALADPASFDGVGSYYDGAMDDARITLEVALSAEAAGAVILNYCEVINIKDTDSNKVITSLDHITNEEISIQAREIVLAVGHWSDVVGKIINPQLSSRIRPTKGIHIITRKFYTQDRAIVVPVDDGRIIFILPFGENNEFNCVGTTDTDFTGNFEHIPVTKEDINYLISAVNKLFPHSLSQDMVISAYSGIRPLVRPEKALSESDISRNHEIYTITDHVLAIAGGKFTTYRVMAKDVVDKVTKRKCLSHKKPIWGWNSIKRDKWTQWSNNAQKEMMKEGLTALSAHHLLRYGIKYPLILAIIKDNPSLKNPIANGRAEILAEIEYAVRYEKAFHVTDFLLRRTQLQLSVNQGLDCLDTVAKYMGALLKWSNDELQKEKLNYQTNLVWQSV